MNTISYQIGDNIIARIAESEVSATVVGMYNHDYSREDMQYLKIRLQSDDMVYVNPAHVVAIAEGTNPDT